MEFRRWFGGSTGQGWLGCVGAGCGGCAVCVGHYTAFAVSMTVMLLHLIRFLVCAAVRFGIASLVVIF